MPDLKDIIHEKLDRINKIPAKFQTEVEISQKQIFNKILAKLNGLDLDPKGAVLPTSNNLAMIKELGTDLKKIISDPKGKYMDAVSSFINEFSEQKTLTNSIFNKTFEEAFNPKGFEPLFQNSVKTATSLVANSAVTEQVVAFEDMLQTAIGSGDTYNNIVKNISTLIQGDDKIPGTMQRYAKQNAKDIFSVADRQYSKAIADELDAQFFEWAGGLIATSRPFCIERDGNVYHKKEIEAWGSGKKTQGLNWPKNGKWAGRASGTSAQTIFALAAGYFCDHVPIPVGLKYVPIDVLRRAIKNGYIKKKDLPKDTKNNLYSNK